MVIRLEFDIDLEKKKIIGTENVLTRKRSNSRLNGAERECVCERSDNESSHGARQTPRQISRDFDNVVLAPGRSEFSGKCTRACAYALTPKPDVTDRQEEILGEFLDGTTPQPAECM